MSGQWELVGKKREKTSKLPVAKNNNGSSKTKKVPVNNIKLEEILPKSQVQGLYSNNKSNKENKKPNEKQKLQEINIKKSQKKEKTQDSVKPKPPKSIESALNSIDFNEFQTIFENTQQHFPDAPIIWLKELVQMLNQKMPLQVPDPVFSTKKECYPLSEVPSGIKTIIEKAILQAGKSNTQLFFDICLTSMASDMSKDLSALGNKILLQYIALNDPKLVSENLNKYLTLKNSYQNRPNIGLSILWAIGHVGINNFQCGFEVFQQLFLPLIEMKNYSRYVCNFLLKLLDRKDITITIEEYLLVLDTVHSNKKNFPVDMKNVLAEKISEIKPLLFSNKKEKYSNMFEVIFKKILVSNNKSYQDCLCDILIDIFHKDDSTLANWNKMYSKNIATSAVILQFISDNWKTTSKKINKAAFSKLLESFKLTNVEYSTKKNIGGLKESNLVIKSINEKMVAKKSSGSVLKTILITSILLTQIILVVILYQAFRSGELTEENIKQKFVSAGLYPVFEYLQKGNGLFWQGIYWIDERLEDSFPGYLQTITNVVEPYVDLTLKVRKILCMFAHNIHEYTLENYPVFLQNIEYYVPGLMENSQKMFSQAYSFSFSYYNFSKDYLSQKVFVDQFSPENIQRVIYEAFNTTQQKASEYYYWIYDKVQTTIK